MSAGPNLRRGHRRSLPMTLILGAGQAGLAAAYYLQQANQEFLLLDANDRIGDQWRRRWDGLSLFSPQRYNALPGWPPPGGPDYLPTRLEAADYLENYAAHYGFPIRMNQRVKRVSKADDFLVETETDRFRADRVIVATGAYRTPYIPKIVQDAFPRDMPQRHAAEIADISEIGGPDASVLVVGAGASGLQLSRLLLETGAAVTLVGPKLGDLPRSILGKDIYWWLYKSGLITLRTDRGLGKLISGEMGDVTVAEHPGELAKHPKLRRIVNHVERFGDDRIYFRCKQSDPDGLPWSPKKNRSLLWCTGYRNRWDFLPEGSTGEDGETLHLRADAPFTSATHPGLHFLGLPKLRRMNSSLMGGVGEDARALITTFAGNTHI